MTNEHLSFDELAELVEGLLARRKAATAQAHLDSCDECAARAETLRQTTASLGELGPLTMPADVAARLDRALAEAAQAPTGDTVVPDIGAAGRRRLASVPWPYAAAASIVVVVAAVGIAVATVGHHSNHGATNDGAISKALLPLVATANPQQLVQEESDQTYTPGSLATLVPSLVPGGTPSSQSGAGAGSGSLGTEPGGTGSTATGASHGPLAAAPNLAPAPQYLGTEKRPVPASLRPYADSRSALLACAAYITDTAGASPLAVDYARWSDAASHVHDAPSLILVFAVPGKPTKLDVFVVAPACNGGSLRDFSEISR